MTVTLKYPVLSVLNAREENGQDWAQWALALTWMRVEPPNRP